MITPSPPLLFYASIRTPTQRHTYTKVHTLGAPLFYRAANFDMFIKAIEAERVLPVATRRIDDDAIIGRPTVWLMKIGKFVLLLKWV